MGPASRFQKAVGECSSDVFPRQKEHLRWEVRNCVNVCEMVPYAAGSHSFGPKILRRHDLGRDYHLLGTSAQPLIVDSCFKGQRLGPGLPPDSRE